MMGKAFLGVGWKFPVKVDPTTGHIMTSEYEEDIKEAIQIILRTSPGERLMRPEFGCGIYNYSFDLIDETTIRLMESSIDEAIRVWEPRVHQVNIEAIPDKNEMGMLKIHVSYAVRSTNNLYNLVYPFYLHEGAK